MSPPLRVATRGSRLACWQAERVVALLGRRAELVVVHTEGDRRADVPIHAMGGRGVFVKEVQAAVLDGRADVAVHSAKDLPSTTPDGLVLAAVPERADPRDVLVGAALDDLPTGARVATGSVRRRAQLAARRPDLGFAELRGNLETRLARAADFDAIVTARAALERLGRVDAVAETLPPNVVLPQAGQGAIAVECRAGDTATRAALAEVDDPGAHTAVRAERAFLARLGGGCDQPVAALASVEPGGVIRLAGLLASLDGRVVLRTAGEGTDPEALGASVADALLERCGGRMLLGAS